MTSKGVQWIAAAILLASAVSSTADDSDKSQIELFAHLSPDGKQIAFLSAISGRYHLHSMLNEPGLQQILGALDQFLAEYLGQ